MYALLIAEDSDEAAILSLVLQRAGLAVTSSNDLERAMQSWTERPADIVLVAVHQTAPLAQVRRVRAETEAALVLVVEPIGEKERCALLENGADLVAIRPFSARLLIAQVRALLRRTGGVPIFSLPTLSLGGLTLDPATRTVQVEGQSPRRLTHLEFRLLYTLMIHRGQVLPTDTIVERVWGYSGEGDRDLVRGLISRLRAKVEVDPRNPQYILTASGIGYAFRGDDG
ncbi:MAG: response regulator transcription factor [Anaerolineales bacterium]|nr:response regulator transcription factor [Anaerolineales bacterium]